MSEKTTPIYEIVRYPAAILAKPCQEVTQFNESLQQTIERMRPTMHAAIGVGLAANQIDSPYAFAVIEFIPAKNEDQSERVPFHAIINPKIIEYGPEQDEMEEGCLSCPGIEVNIRRSTWVKVRAQRPDGQVYETKVEGFGARIYQHEIDHLNGLLIIDRAHGQKALIEAYRANPKKFADKAEAVAKKHTKTDHMQAI